jgi:hypothetical protein
MKIHTSKPEHEKEGKFILPKPEPEGGGRSILRNLNLNTEEDPYFEV